MTSISCSDSHSLSFCKWAIHWQPKTMSARSHIKTLHQEANNANASLNSVFKACHALVWPQLTANASFLVSLIFYLIYIFYLPGISKKSKQKVCKRSESLLTKQNFCCNILFMAAWHDNRRIAFSVLGYCITAGKFNEMNAFITVPLEEILRVIKLTQIVCLNKKSQCCFCLFTGQPNAASWQRAREFPQPS